MMHWDHLGPSRDGIPALAYHKFSNGIFALLFAPGIRDQNYRNDSDMTIVALGPLNYYRKSMFVQQGHLLKGEMNI